MSKFAVYNHFQVYNQKQVSKLSKKKNCKSKNKMFCIVFLCWVNNNECNLEEDDKKYEEDINHEKFLT